MHLNQTRTPPIGFEVHFTAALVTPIADLQPLHRRLITIVRELLSLILALRILRPSTRRLLLILRCAVHILASSRRIAITFIRRRISPGGRRRRRGVGGRSLRG